MGDSHAGVLASRSLGLPLYLLPPPFPTPSPPTHTPSHRNTKSLPSLCACLFFLHHLLKKKVAQPVVYQVAQPVYQPVVQQVVAPAPVVYAAPAAQQVVYAGEAGK